jgi:hypothetical protein
MSLRGCSFQRAQFQAMRRAYDLICLSGGPGAARDTDLVALKVLALALAGASTAEEIAAKALEFFQRQASFKRERGTPGRTQSQTVVFKASVVANGVFHDPREVA